MTGFSRGVFFVCIPFALIACGDDDSSSSMLPDAAAEAGAKLDASDERPAKDRNRLDLVGSDQPINGHVTQAYHGCGFPDSVSETVGLGRFRCWRFGCSFHA